MARTPARPTNNNVSEHQTTTNLTRSPSRMRIIAAKTNNRAASARQHLHWTVSSPHDDGIAHTPAGDDPIDNLPATTAASLQPG
jgi:hypothetical protein